MGDVTLARKQTVLERTGTVPPDHVAFAAPEFDPEAVVQLRLPLLDWLDFGEPDELTVTVEPGDRLNP